MINRRENGKRKAILVTGGAGYIGSHVALQLAENGEEVIVLDNLSRGFKEAVISAELVVGDVGNAALVDELLAAYNIDTVMHFAAYTIVPESVTNPLKYYRNNTVNTQNLLECCARAQVKNVVFSSTAAVYGTTASGIASENTPTLPINPYGQSKLMSEFMLRDLSNASQLRYVALRYFNVAGSDPSGRIGQRTKGATLLTKVAVEHAVGKRSSVAIYGTDFDTADGTGVRDYIHVQDLSNAHIKALAYLREGGASTTLNCGYGHGVSVREVLTAVERAAGKPLTIREEPRRAGDPPMLIAEAQRIRGALNWSPEHDDLDHIVTTALLWERHMHAGSV